MALWMPPMAHVLDLELRLGITGGDPDDTVMRLGDIGKTEHLLHEIAHAVLLDIVIDGETRRLSDAVSSEIRERARLQQSHEVPALYEIETFAAESLVIERLGLPLSMAEIHDALVIQVGNVFDDFVQRMEDARGSGRVVAAVDRICEIIAPGGPQPARMGAAFQRVTRDGFEITVYPMALGNARLCLGEVGDEGMLNAWCYQSDKLGDGLEKAIAGGAEWDGEGDDPPGGWYRNPQTGRRRPGGDPKQEFVHW